MRLSGSSGEGSGRKRIKGKELVSVHKNWIPIVLKPGDKVRWKKMHKNKQAPEYGEVAEVFRVLDVPLVSGQHGSQYHAESCDFTMLYADNDGDYMEYAYDSRRFELVK